MKAIIVQKLNKEICRNCFREQSKDWCFTAETNWRNNAIPCMPYIITYRLRISNCVKDDTCLLPDDCPHKAEHILQPGPVPINVKLKKDVCKKCCNENDSRYHEGEQWNKNWDDGYVFCPYYHSVIRQPFARHRVIDDEPPDECPYKLEHTVMNQ